MRSQLKRTRPRDAVEGEEFETTGHGPRRWIIDPIDGTKNFVRGVPVWATLIGLVVDNMPVLGPRRPRLPCSAAGGPRPGPAPGPDARCRRPAASRCRRSAASATRRCPTPRSPGGACAAAATTSSTSWTTAGAPAPTATSGPTCSSPRVRPTSRPSPSSPCTTWPPSSTIVEEAGGRFTGLDGKDGCWSGNALATNGLLHDEVLSRIGMRPRVTSGATSSALRQRLSA